MKRWIYLILILISAGLLFQCAPQKKKGGEEPETIHILAPLSLSSLPVMMIDNLTMGGKKIDVEFFTDHSLSMAQFLQSEADILMTGFSLGLKTASEHPGIRHMATPVWGVSSLISLDPGLADLKAFSGKSVSVPFAGSPLELQLIHIMETIKVKKEIHLEYSPIQQSIPLLLQGKIDGICVPEPLASRLVLENNGQRVFRFQDEWAQVTGGEKRSPQVTIFMKAEFGENQSRFLSHVHRALVKNIEIIREDPAELAATYSTLFSVSPAVMEEGIKHTLFQIPGHEETRSIIADYVKRIFPGTPLPDQFFQYNN
jgi:hypothetical protein